MGRKIFSTSGDDREAAFLFQKVSVLVQRYNAVLLRDSLPVPDCTDWWSVPNFVLSWFLNSLGIISTEGKNNNNISI